MNLFNNKNKSLDYSKFFNTSEPISEDFIFKIDTSLGNGLNQYVLELTHYGVINYTVDWGDGSNTVVNSDIVSTHNYSLAGIYEIKIKVISGVINYFLGFPKQDYLKVIEILNIGSYKPNTCVFYACGYPNYGLINFTDVCFIIGVGNSNFQTTTIININLNFDNATRLRQTFRHATATNWNFLLNTNIPNVVDMYRIFSGSCNLDSLTYQLLLIHWTGWDGTTATKTLKNNVPADFGNSRYEIGGQSEDARNYLINTLGWTIIDGGGI